MFKFKLPFFSKISRSKDSEKERMKAWYRDSQRMRAEDRLYLEQLEKSRVAELSNSVKEKHTQE